MLTRLNSFETIGLKSELVTVEVDVPPHLTGFTIVGLADTAVQESKVRIRSALQNSGCEYPCGRRITINLAPADIKKVGPRYDLPMALGILISSGALDLDPACLSDTVFIGELALDGSLRHVSALLPVALAARAKGMKRIVVPESNGAEAALVPGLEVIAPKNLSECVKVICKQIEAPKISIPAAAKSDISASLVDFSDVRGQEQAKRAMEIAAAGGHNVLMNGAPGAGKTLLANAFRGILPPLTREESLEVTQIYSVANLLPRDLPLVEERPFRSVHHTASSVSIVGGGRAPKPGEISLAHHGVLFLDELAEFPTNVMEVLRQPLEDRKITITRANGSVTFPANFILVAAMNPPSFSVSNRKNRISKPLMDRIDLNIDIQPVDVEDLRSKRRYESESSNEILGRVVAARKRQSDRFKNLRISVNAQMGVKDLEKLCPLDAESEELIIRSVRQLGLSVRGCHKIIKLARTIADLTDCDDICQTHIAEAVQYRHSHVSI